MRIVLVEDDFDQAEHFQQWLQDGFQGASVERIYTEKALRDKLSQFAAHPPDAFVVDIMLRWTDSSPDMAEPPQEVAKHKHFRAGIRCVRLLSKEPTLREIPVVIYSMLEREDVATDLGDLPETVAMLCKGYRQDDLIMTLRRLLGDRR